MKKHAIVFGILLSLFFAGTVSGQPDRGAEVDSLLRGSPPPVGSSGSIPPKSSAAQGLTDPRLYARLAALLKEGYAGAVDADPVDEMAWFCKALAASGDADYRPLLQEVAAHAPTDKLKHYAEQSNALIEDYAKRNQVLNATESWDASLSVEENRLLNMLASSDSNLKRDAAKLIVRRPRVDPKVFAAAAAALTGMAGDNPGDALDIDTMAWLCKALAASGDHTYVAPLQQVMEKTESQKLKDYAAKAMKAL